MTNLQKHLKTAKVFFFIFIVLFFFSSCKKEPVKKKFVARVNNAYLTQAELDSIFSSNSGTQFKNEIVRNWINRELLFQEARKEGILKENNFKEIINNSEKELAASFVMNNFLNKVKLEADEPELETYYKKNSDEFRLVYKSYLLNLITFNSEEKALKFRSQAVEKSWYDAASYIQDDSSIIASHQKDLMYEYEIQPVSVLRLVRELYPAEISIVVNNNGSYTVAQLIEKFEKGSLPPLDLIKEKIKKAYLNEKRELTVKDYIKELYSKNDIEVKN